MPIKEITPEEHAALLHQVSELPYEKAKQLEDALQMLMGHYHALWAEIDDTVRKYKETARKIKGQEE
jgi:predicted  nucleic acid-binding Zn-ribbon protein